MSNRATKKCWCTGAYNPGAIRVPCRRCSSAFNAPKLRIPVSFTSASMLPSCNNQHREMSEYLSTSEIVEGYLSPVMSLLSLGPVAYVNLSSDLALLFVQWVLWKEITLYNGPYKMVCWRTWTQKPITPRYLVEMPVEPIFIICNCAEERDCETTGSANFFKSCTPVLMLPHNAMIFFMHAHTVFDCLNLSMEVCEVCIKVLDVPKTITPLQIWCCNHQVKHTISCVPHFMSLDLAKLDSSSYKLQKASCKQKFYSHASGRSMHISRSRERPRTTLTRFKEWQFLPKPSSPMSNAFFR